MKLRPAGTMNFSVQTNSLPRPVVLSQGPFESIGGAYSIDLASCRQPVGWAFCPHNCCFAARRTAEPLVPNNLNLPTPSPPAEKATARQDQARHPSAGDGAGHRERWVIQRHGRYQ